MTAMTVASTPLFRTKLAAIRRRAEVAAAFGVSHATLEKVLREERGIGPRVIAGALTYWAPLRFEDLFRIIPDAGTTPRP